MRTSPGLRRLAGTNVTLFFGFDTQKTAADSPAGINLGVSKTDSFCIENEQAPIYNRTTVL